MSSFDRPRSHSFYDVKLVSPEKGRKRGKGRRGEVRSLGADEIKRDDLAIHASSGVGRRTRFGYTFLDEPQSVEHYDKSAL